MVHFTYGLNFMALLIKAAWLCGLEVFQRIQRNVLFSRWGSGLSPLKQGKNFQFSRKSWCLLWLKQPLFLKKRKRKKRFCRKKMKSTTKSEAQAFFPATQFYTFKTNSTNWFERKWQKSLYTNAIWRPLEHLLFGFYYRLGRCYTTMFLTSLEG